MPLQDNQFYALATINECYLTEINGTPNFQVYAEYEGRPIEGVIWVNNEKSAERAKEFFIHHGLTNEQLDSAEWQEHIKRHMSGRVADVVIQNDERYGHQIKYFNVPGKGREKKSEIASGSPFKAKPAAVGGGVDDDLPF